MTADLRRLVKKLWRCSKYPSLYKRQSNYKKTECLRREGYIPPLCSANPPKPLVTPLCMWSPMGDVITRTILAQSVQELETYGIPNSLFPIHSDDDPYNSTVSTTVLYCDAAEVCR